MKKTFTVFILFLFCSIYVLAQTAVIKVEAISDYRLKNELKKTVTLNSNRWATNGLPVAAPKTMIWLSGSISTGTATTYAWTITSQPAGSASTITDATSKMMSLVPDIIGSYIIKLTINGTINALDTVYCGTYRGVGTINDQNYSSGTPDDSKLQCAACHKVMGTEVTDWAKTKHASIFKKGITGQLEFVESADGSSNPGGQYGATCAPCHTTGFNSGFDNTQASSSGFLSFWWANGFTKPDTSGNSVRKMFSFDGSRWTSMSTEQKQYATIGCESCHGPYYMEHIAIAKRSNVTLESGVCLQCHDAPYTHTIGRQYANSPHSTMTVTSSGGACRQCHSGLGLYEVINARAANRTPSFTSTPASPIGCSICHDPHSTTNEYQLRTVVADTLANGDKIAKGGLGKLCMNCHIARSSAVAAIITNYAYSTRLGPHHGPQGDLYLGRNAIEFNESYKVSITGLMSHEGVENACVTCHMSAGPVYNGPLGFNNPGIDQMGGHTFKVSGYKSIPDGMSIKTTDSTIVDNVSACAPCHGAITEFSDIKATADYDGDDVIEGVDQEIQGLLTKVENKLIALGLTKSASTGWLTLRATSATKADSVLLATNIPARKAFYNYTFFKEDKSSGMHNAKYTINVLLRTLAAFSGTGGVYQEDILKPAVYALSPNYPNPFNPSTKINFSVPKDANIKINIYSINGQLVATLLDNFMQTGSYTVTWDGRTNTGSTASSGIYFYQMRAPNYVITKKMSLVK